MSAKIFRRQSTSLIITHPVNIVVSKILLYYLYLFRFPSTLSLVYTLPRRTGRLAYGPLAFHRTRFFLKTLNDWHAPLRYAFPTSPHVNFATPLSSNPAENTTLPIKFISKPRPDTSQKKQFVSPFTHTPNPVI